MKVSVPKILICYEPKKTILCHSQSTRVFLWVGKKETSKYNNMNKVRSYILKSKKAKN